MKLDCDFYREWYLDAAGLDDAGVRSHWQNQTQKRYGSFQELTSALGLDPTKIPTDFDWRAYLELNADLPDDWSRWRAMYHYLEFGHKENRPYRGSRRTPAQRAEIDAILGLDEEWYADTYGVTRAAATEHYHTLGRRNLLAPNRDFSPIGYWLLNHDVAKALVDPVTHYGSFGYDERRRIGGARAADEHKRTLHDPGAISVARAFFAFDPEHYLAARPDLGSGKISLQDHYNVHGEKEGTRPNAFFNGVYYRQTYAREMTGWSLSALDHFLSVGIITGLFPSEEVADGAKRARLHSAIDWVGHWTQQDGMRALSAPGAAPRAELKASEGTRMVQASHASRKVLNWVIPAFSKGGGGHTTIFRCARTLFRMGWESVFWVEDATSAAQIDDLYAEYIGYFPTTTVSFRRLEEGFAAVKDEFIVATAWQTAFCVARNKHPNVRLYFVQDRESLFSAAGSAALRAEWTYEMGFDFICAGEWLENLVAPRGGDHTRFELCAEPLYLQKDPPLAQRDVLAAIYIRGHTNRRCSDMMIEAANRLALAGRGEVVIFGDEHPGGSVNPLVTNAGILSASQMADLFHRTRFGLVASATNYSILPVELAAAGVVVCQPASESTQATTVAKGAIATEPSAAILADTVLGLAQGLDQARFDELRRPYMDFARSLSWEREFEKVGEWLATKVRPDAAGAPAIALRRKACVVIPTYYPDQAFIEVLDAVRGQLSSYDVTIQVVDSRKQGMVSPVIEQIGSRDGVKLHALDAATFQHGETRNLGASLCEADYYAYLTQDALPASEYWLESLLAPLRMLPDCAYAFGRHRAYAGHHPIYDYELGQHFDGFVNHGFVTNRRRHAGRYDRDPFFRANLCFNSDNNAAYRGDVLRRYRFPAVDFAEDQALAKRLLDAGYSRAYCPSAVVFHSHDYTGDFDEARRRGVEEGDALFQNFGLVRFRTVTDFIHSKRHVERTALADGARLGLSQSQVRDFIGAKLAYLDGVWASSRRLLGEEAAAAG
jgi:GT2 family glycosyltransferase